MGHQEWNWLFREKENCRCLERVVYTDRATNPEYQCLNVYAPAAYFKEDGTPDPDGVVGSYTAKSAPVVFHNNAAGYMQMPPAGPDFMPEMVKSCMERGFVLISCGCRGRETIGPDGTTCGKSPWTLIDIKTAIRFARHHANQLPGDMTRMISVGTSAGGAMSSLVGVTGDAEVYLPYLEENGAYMEESDAVFAAQIYCPIINLEHADMAHEWQFRDDMDYEHSPVSPAGSLTPFTAALAQELSAAYVEYFNDQHMKHPDTGEVLSMDAGGRSGSGYDYLLNLLEESASKFLKRLQEGRSALSCTVEQYLSGDYTYQTRKPGPPPGGPDGMPPAPGGPGGMPPMPGGPAAPGGFAPPPMQLVTVQGSDKRGWLSWDGAHAHITGLNDYFAYNRRRGKPCPAFDTLACTSAENQEFGTKEQDKVHFSVSVGEAINRLKERFPVEAERYQAEYAPVFGNADLEMRKSLIDPMTFLSADSSAAAAKQFRIRVGSKDADTAFVISMELALKLKDLNLPVDYALVWDEGHGDADYPGEFCDWVMEICK